MSTNPLQVNPSIRRSSTTTKATTETPSVPKITTTAKASVASLANRCPILPSARPGPKPQEQKTAVVPPPTSKFRVIDTRTPLPAAMSTSFTSPGTMIHAVNRGGSRRLSHRTDINMKLQKAILHEEKYIRKEQWAAYREIVNTTNKMSNHAHKMMLMMLLGEARRYQRSHPTPTPRSVTPSVKVAVSGQPLPTHPNAARSRLDIVPARSFKVTVCATLDVINTVETPWQSGRPRPVTNGPAQLQNYQNGLLELARCLLWDP